MKDYEADLDQLNYEVNSKGEKKPNAYKDLNFRYHFFLDFFMLQITCFLLTFFMLGIRDFIGEKKMNIIFDNYWYITMVPLGVLVIEVLSVYLFFKKIILLGKPWVIICLYFLFILCFAFITCMSSLSSVITCMFFEGLLTMNIMTFIVMNSIRALEDKNIIKLFVLYLNTFSVIIIYIILVNKRYIIFFILGTSSVLYFSYMIHNYKRMIIINFPFLEKTAGFEDRRALNIPDQEADGLLPNLRAYDDQERKILERYSTSILTKISFVASLVDTTVFNFS